ncbi:MAG: DUF305 domain-containing protein [Terrimesophilobacter sp.]
MSLRARLALILGTALVIVAAFVAGMLTSPSSAFPTNTSAEAGFARDMQTHHSQAVELSMIVRDRTFDPDIRLLAYDIALTQQQQVGQMYSWLTVWGLPQAAAEPSMTWMVRSGLSGAGHDQGDASTHPSGEPMPGLATPAQLEKLKASSEVQAEILYLQLMIAHHKGGVEMAQAVLDRSENRVVVTLAKSMVIAQQAEIDYMSELLAARTG